jgi:2-methylisocitrate lyase-like PEP mutase family enzyme
MSADTQPTQTLRQRVEARRFFVAPGVYDLISARIADAMGFQALYMTGYGTVASALGLPDAGIATYRDMVERVDRTVQRTTTPLIADGDTGYGGLVNVQHTMRGYERAGAAAIQLEDQEMPKKCGHTPGRRVVDTADMVKKIQVAVETRDSADFLIVARTDARTTHGLDEALRRAEAYGKAGADILFVESPESEEEMARICSRLDKPVLMNMVEGGRTPILPAATLQELGYAFAIYPASGFLAAGAALTGIYQSLQAEGSTLGTATPLASFADFTRLMGFEEVWDLERRYADER